MPSITILFPNSWPAERRDRATRAVARAVPPAVDVIASVSRGPLEAPCVDSQPIGAESVVSRILEATP